jgi:hypothetical protein
MRLKQPLHFSEGTVNQEDALKVADHELQKQPARHVVAGWIQIAFELQEALARYGQHTTDCALTITPYPELKHAICTCGWKNTHSLLMQIAKEQET